jgi:uncharacterized protein YbjT (DUF2867 family)
MLPTAATNAKSAAKAVGMTTQSFSTHPPLASDALVTIIGGSGFLGRYIVQQLAEAGYRVRVVVRHPDTALFLKPLGSLGQIQIVAGNIATGAGIAHAFAGRAPGSILSASLMKSPASALPRCRRPVRPMPLALRPPPV